MFRTTIIAVLLFITLQSFAGEGHDAGEEWAEENGITDAYDCGGNTNSFIEGCEDYVNQMNEEQEEAEREMYEQDEYYN
jgi:hypothetical protein